MLCPNLNFDLSKASKLQEALDSGKYERLNLAEHLENLRAEYLEDHYGDSEIDWEEAPQLGDPDLLAEMESFLSEGRRCSFYEVCGK